MKKEENYFSLFGFPVSFEIDLVLLTQRYRDLQKVAHPDRFATASSQERLHSVSRASLINDAYDTLKNPFLRARYILLINGIEMGESGTIKDGAFLMQQMELREALDLAESDLERLEDLIDKIDNLYQSQLALIKKEFAKDSPAFNDIAEMLGRLQFFMKLIEEAEARREKLENS